MPIISFLHLLRPTHWIKNGFVFFGLLFGHAWADVATVAAVLLTFAAFCLTASFVYVVNDLADIEADRAHPIKCRRPIASGAVSGNRAKLLAAVLIITGLGLGWLVGPKALAIIAGYGVLNLAYSFGLKHVVILDVFIIAAGFMLRIMAGTVGVGIAPSKWLVICGLMVTLFLGFAKRRAELAQMGGSKQRRVLEHYSLPLLDMFIAVTASSAIITYSLYTVAPETVALHHTDSLVYTVPLVLYAIFRYIFILHKRGHGEDPATDLFRDPHILVAVLAWGVLTVRLLT